MVNPIKALDGKRARFVEKYIRKPKAPQQIQPEPVISAPQNRPEPGGRYVDLVVAELNRQDDRTVAVMQRFVDLNKALLAQDRALLKSQTTSEKTFVSEAAKVRAQVATVCMDAARAADKAEADYVAAMVAEDTDERDRTYGLFDSALTAARAGFDRIAKAAGDALDAAGDAGGLDAALQDARGNEADAGLAAEYDSLRAETGKIVDKLLGWGATDADKLAGFFAKGAPRKPDNYAAALEKLRELDTIARLALTKHENEYYALRRPVEDDFLALKQRREELKKTHDYDVLSSAQKQIIKDQFAMIETAMDSGRNPGALEAAQDLIAAGQKMVETIVGAGDRVERIAYRLERFEAVMGSSGYKKIRPEHHAALSQDYEDFKKNNRTMELSEASAKGSDLRKRIYAEETSYEKTALRQIAWREIAKTRMKDIKALLDRVDKQFRKQIEKNPDAGSVKKFEGEILTTYDQIGDLIKSEPEINMAVADGMMLAMEARLNRWLDNPADDDVKREIASDHAMGRQKDSAAESRRVALQRDFEAMEEEFRSTRKEYQTRETKTDFKEISGLKKTARDMLKKDETLDQAEQLIERCRTRTRSLKDGSKKLNRGKMGEIGREWAGVVDKINKDVEALLQIIIDRAGKDEPALDANGQGRLARTLIGATDLFDPASFNKAATIFAQPDAGDADLRKAREEALSHVYRYREIITNDPVLKKLMANPFGVDVLSNAYQTLQDFEYKSLIAV